MSPPNICFIDWICLPSSEWAAWWQGVGTVIAVVTALGIALYQQREQSRAKARDAAEATQRSARMAVLFGAKLRDALRALEVACKVHDDQQIKLERRILREVQRWPEQIDVSHLQTKGALGFLNLRNLCTEAVAIEHSGIPILLAADEYAALATHAHTQLQAIGATFPKLG